MWVLGPVWTGEGNPPSPPPPAGIRSPYHATRTESLYRLSYPGSRYSQSTVTKCRTRHHIQNGRSRQSSAKEGIQSLRVTTELPTSKRVLTVFVVATNNNKLLRGVTRQGLALWAPCTIRKLVFTALIDGSGPLLFVSDTHAANRVHLRWQTKLTLLCYVAAEVSIAISRRRHQMETNDQSRGPAAFTPRVKSLKTHKMWSWASPDLKTRWQITLTPPPGIEFVHAVTN